MAVLFSWSSVPFFCLYAQSFAGLNPTIVNPGCFGFSLGSSCVCINFARKGDLFMTIMPFLAQGETVAPRQPVMHHGFPKMHHDFGQCTKLSPEMHHENEKCTKLFLKCTKANGKMQPGFLILSK